jgi:hypothetical protein
MKRFRNRITSAHVIAMLALFVAMGGTGYAALSLPKNSVGSKQIKKNAVTSTKVKNGSLKAGDFKAGSLPAGPAGPVGPVGPVGATGATGATGTFGSVTVQSFTSAADVAPGAKAQINAICPDGTTAIGGGGRGDDQNSEDTNVSSSRPLVDAGGGVPADGTGFTGWRLTVTNNNAGATPSIRPTVWAICATPAG